MLCSTDMPKESTVRAPRPSREFAYSTDLHGEFKVFMLPAGRS